VRRTNAEIAAEIIRNVSREKPADAALREVLKRQRDLPPFDAAEISSTVFRHYRWFGWVREERNLENKLRVARQLEEQFHSRPDSVSFADLKRRAVPAWLLDEMQVSVEWLRALQTPPKLWLRAKRGQGKGLARKLGLVETPDLPEAFVHEGEADLFKTAEFHAGEFEIQDIASQLVGLFCAPKPGETWWDACAGEGGKLMHLSDLMENKGLIWASDRAEWRLKNLKRRAARGKVFNYRLVAWDGGARLPTKTKFDGVLVDAPCSGVGTWQRNPHARWTTAAIDVKELAEVQRRLLAHVAPSVNPGGKLVYSVCTLTRAETSGVTEEFNQCHPDFEPLPLPRVLPMIASAAQVTLWPQDLGGNGMFVAAWRRRA
jgi:16S rRNA (cytosine967-C5)-methyltransferase